MSFKLAFLFVVCFLALAGAIPVEKPEEVQDTKETPVAAEPEKEAAEENSDPEEKEEEEESPSEDQEAEQEQDPEQEEGENDEEDKQDEEEPEADDTEEEPENEVEAKENDVNDPTPGRYSRYHPKCKYKRKRVRRCYKKLKCSGSYYSRRGRCCRRVRYCRYVLIKVRICQICRRKCRHVCKYKRRRVCQRFPKCVWRRRRVRRGRRGYYHYQYIRYRYCKYVTRCRYIRYRFCQIKCYGYICRYPG